jgi:hypothetical protein
VADERDVAREVCDLILVERPLPEALLVEPDHRGHETFARVAVRDDALLPAVAERVVRCALGGAGLRAEDVGQAVLHPHDARHLLGQPDELAAVVVDHQDQVGAELRADFGEQQRVGDLVVGAFDQQSRVVTELAERRQPVAHRVLEKRREEARDAEHAQAAARHALRDRGQAGGGVKHLKLPKQLAHPRVGGVVRAGEERVEARAAGPDRRVDRHAEPRPGHGRVRAHRRAGLIGAVLTHE